MDKVINKVDRLNELEAIASGMAKAHEQLLNKVGTALKDINLSEQLLKEALDAYNDQITEDIQDECLADSQPLLFAIGRGFQDRLVRKQALDSKTGVYTVSVEVDYDKDVIDLIALNKKGENLSHDGQWVKFIPTVHKLFQVAIAKALGDVDADTKGYALKKSELGVRPDMIGKPVSILEIADIKSDADPFSIGSLTTVLQTIVNMIVGPDKFYLRRRDARFIVSMCAKEGKKLTYRFSNERTLFALIVKASHAALNEADYAEFVK